MDVKTLAAEMLQKTRMLMKANGPKQIGAMLHGEMFIMHYILQKNDDVLPSEIAAAMGVSTARVAMALKSMEKKGVIERRPDQTDRRKVRVSITEYGKSLIRERHKNLVRKMEQILMELGEADAQEYIRIVTRMIEISKKLNGGSNDECTHYHCS